MRDEVDDLSLLFSAQASERAFQAAFAPLKAASREEEACAALEALQALLRVPPNLRQIEVDAGLQALSQLRLPFERLMHPPRRYWRLRAALASLLEGEVARRAAAAPPVRAGPRREFEQLQHELTQQKKRSVTKRTGRRLGAVGPEAPAIRFKGKRPEPKLHSWRPPHLQLPPIQYNAYSHAGSAGGGGGGGGGGTGRGSYAGSVRSGGASTRVLDSPPRHQQPARGLTSPSLKGSRDARGGAGARSEAGSRAACAYIRVNTFMFLDKRLHEYASYAPTMGVCGVSIPE